LFNKRPIVVDTDLAICFGVNEAIVIQQIHYWLEINRETEKNFINGRYWTYNSIGDWHEKNFPFWSYDTVKRIFKELEKLGLLITDNFNEQKRDRTKWYSIDYEKLDQLMEAKNNQRSKSPNALGQDAPMSLGQNAPMDQGNLPQPLPEINTEITTEKKINMQIENLRQRYAQDALTIIDEYFEILRFTRRGGQIADSVILKIYKEWENFRPDVVEYALKLYIDNPKHHDKKENYCYGIMRNATAEQVGEYLLRKQSKVPEATWGKAREKLNINPGSNKRFDFEEDIE
jgi:hypothetical protein